MSYTDGIGNLPQVAGTIAPEATKPAQQVAGRGAASKDSRPIGDDGASVVSTDRADLSSAGGLISKAMEGSDVRTEKVQALQQTIASGSYHVSSSDVADKLIQSLLD